MHQVKKDFSTFEKKIFEKFNRFGILIIFLVLYSWRPFVLGFYADDWSIFTQRSVLNIQNFSLTKLQFYKTIHFERIGRVIPDFLTSSLFQDNPMLWQGCLALLSILFAFLLKKLIDSLFKLLNIKNSNIGNLVTLLWLSLPWLLGITVWSASIPLLLSGIFFLLSSYLIFNAWGNRKISVLLPSFFYLWCLLMYEQFYFQFIIIIVFGLIAGVQKKLGWKSIILPLFGLGLAQSIALFWNRYVAILAHTVKPMSSNWSFMFQQNLTNFCQDVIFKSNYELRKLLLIILILLLLFVLFSVIKGFLNKNYRKISRLHLILLIVSSLGFLTSVFVFSIVGYAFYGIGMISRTTLAVSFWFILIISILISFIVNIGLPVFFKRLLLFLYLSILITFSFSTILRTNDWADSWKMQQVIIEQFPVDKLLKTGKNAAIVYISPSTVNEVNIFLGVIDFTSALLNKYPEIPGGRVFMPHLPQIYPSYFTYGRTRLSFNYNIWDGKTVTYNKDPYIKTDEVYIWNYFTKEFKKMDHPFRIENGEITKL